MDKLLVHPFRQSLRCASRQWRGSSNFHPRFNSTLSETAQKQLTWSEYLAIRRGKRKWEITFTIPSAFLGFCGGVAYFGSLETDITKPIMGFDPFIVYGACTLACLGLGSLFGPVIGSTLWRLTHRRTMNLIEAREREFFKHIAKNRVDPSAQSPTRTIPDYYGEKIGSLRQYRQWLRDQAKYRRRSELPEE